MKTVLCSLATLLVLALSQQSMAGAESKIILQARALELELDKVTSTSSDNAAVRQSILRDMGAEMEKNADGIDLSKAGFQAAIAAFLVYGGSPASVRKLLRSRGAGPTHDTLTALLDAIEKRAEASERLAMIDPLAVPPALGASVALASGLLADKPGESAVKSALATARLLAPGTTMEEASYRQEFVVRLRSGQMGEAINAAARYCWRYSHAPSHRATLNRIVRQLTSEGFVAKLTPMLVEKLAEQMPAEQRPRLLVSIAETAMLRGMLEVSHTAGQKALDITTDSRVEVARARAYISLARRIERNDPPSAVDRAQLPALERALLDAGDSINGFIYSFRPAVLTAPQDPPKSIAALKGAISRADGEIATGGRP